MNLVKISLDYYDRYTTEYRKWRNENNVEIIFDKSGTVTINGKKYKVEVIASYHMELGIWIWSWALYDKQITNLSRKLRDYGDNVDTSDATGKFLKTIFTSSRIGIDNDLQLEVISAICSYISKITNINQAIGQDDEGLVHFYTIMDLQL